eukprot:8239813-Pyramimonas_sp.AAC.1
MLYDLQTRRASRVSRGEIGQVARVAASDQVVESGSARDGGQVRVVDDHGFGTDANRPRHQD